jgi:hypothetical protein
MYAATITSPKHRETRDDFPDAVAAQRWARAESKKHPDAGYLVYPAGQPLAPREGARA